MLEEEERFVNHELRVVKKYAKSKTDKAQYDLVSKGLLVVMFGECLKMSRVAILALLLF